MAVLVVASVAGTRAQSLSDGRFVERVARIVSPELRRTDGRLEALAAELEGLPELLAGPVASRYGFRSEMLDRQDAPEWVRIDLGKVREMDCLVAVPVNIPAIGERGAGYGFPLRFKIEVADNPEMADAVAVADRTMEDEPNPGQHPLIFRMAPIAGRYVRFTSTRHYPVEDRFIWALEELIVMSGNDMIGLGKQVEASSSLELFPNWASPRINDGMSGLGVPVTRETSPSRGYLSEVVDEPPTEMWLTVDLGEGHAVDEIRFVAIESEQIEVLGRQSLPRRLVVELAIDPAFDQVVWKGERFLNDPRPPGGSPLPLTVPGVRGRHLRLTAQELWGSLGRFGFGLAEVQVYAGGENVALGGRVATSHPTGSELASVWAPEFVVDGFSSRHRLVEWPEYLELIERRGMLERERVSLLARRDHKVRTMGLLLGYGGSGLAVAIALGLGTLLVRQRSIRQRAVARLRDQIARDLHDDIGSNLGGIVLLSEMGSRHSPDEQTRKDFAAIKDAAEETSKSMQDIVWLIGRGNMGLRDLVTRMRLSAQAIIGDKEVSLVVVPTEFRDRELSLVFRRHVFFAFKETLNSVRRHAASGAVELRITIAHARLTFSVRDDGAGFNPSNPPQSGHGLKQGDRRGARYQHQHGVHPQAAGV